MNQAASARSLETDFWQGGRNLLHFIGICGAGKTTMSNRLAERCRAHGGIATGTLDWDPHVPDQHRITERAFRRDLDLAMIEDPNNPDIHRRIIEHSLQVIANWQESKSNLVVVDRFVESYDYLPQSAMREIQLALDASGFAVSQVLLVLGLELNRHDRIATRLKHTREHRPAEWWDGGPGDVDLFAAEEADYQAAYREYCKTSEFQTAVIDTSAMEWHLFEQALVDELMIGANRINSQPWTDSMKRHGIEAHSYFSPSSKLGMSRPGYKWFATMAGSRVKLVPFP